MAAPWDGKASDGWSSLHASIAGVLVNRRNKNLVKRIKQIKFVLGKRRYLSPGSLVHDITFPSRFLSSPQGRRQHHDLFDISL